MGPAFKEWRHEAPTGLTSAERDKIAIAQQKTEDWLNGVKQAESAEARIIWRRTPPKRLRGRRGERHADIEGHEVKEVSGGLGCELHSSRGTPVRCPWQPGGRLPAPEPRYDVYFEVQLPKQDWGLPRDTHFKLAGENMLDLLKTNPQLQKAVSRRVGWSYTQIEDWLVKNPGQAIPGFTWHHALTSQANGVPGVLQLVVSSAHAGPGQARLFHPAGFGGYEQWAVPFGAPK